MIKLLNYEILILWMLYVILIFVLFKLEVILIKKIENRFVVFINSYFFFLFFYVFYENVE